MCGVIIVALNVIIVVVRIFDNIVIDLTMITPNKIIFVLIIIIDRYHLCHHANH